MTTPDPQRVEPKLFGGMVWCGCGGMPVLTKWLSRNWQVSCGVCGTKTMLCRSKVKARAFWNRALAAADAAQPTGRDKVRDAARKLLKLHDASARAKIGCEEWDDAFADLRAALATTTDAAGGDDA